MNEMEHAKMMSMSVMWEGQVSVSIGVNYNREKIHRIIHQKFVPFWGENIHRTLKSCVFLSSMSTTTCGEFNSREIFNEPRSV